MLSCINAQPNIENFIFRINLQLQSKHKCANFEFSELIKSISNQAGFKLMKDKRVNIIGIMINANRQISLYSLHKDYHYSNKGDHFHKGGSAGETSAHGSQTIFQLIEHPQISIGQFVVVYDISCPDIESKIKSLIARLTQLNSRNNNELLPILVSIGDEESTWGEDIRNQVSSLRTVKNTVSSDALFQSIIQQEYDKITAKLMVEIREEVAAEDAAEDAGITPISNMLVLGGFMAVLGSLAVAIAFTVLNAATCGIAGLVVAGVGIALALSGIGIFSAAASRKTQSLPDLPNSDDLAPVY